MRKVAADAADERVVASRALGRQRIRPVGRVVEDAQPGNAENRRRASSGETGSLRSTMMHSLWQLATGIRTQVALIRIESSPRILRVSYTIFISSLVYPSSFTLPICGIALKAIGCAKALHL